jgi:2-dehydropantoate 2-reductase
MKYLIFGAGAIGTYIGGSLALHGRRVTFYARPATAQSLRANGIHLTRAHGSRDEVRMHTVTDSLSEALATQPDVIVFALKSNDTTPALTELRATTATPPPLLCLQNGVDNETAIAHTFGSGSVIAGTVTTAVSKSQPGTITVERMRGVGIGLTHFASQPLVDDFNACDLNARGYRSAEAMKWSKLLINLVGNATSAILDMTVAEIYQQTALFKVEMGMLRECLAVMRATGISVVDLPRTPVRALALAARLPAALARPLLVRGVASGRGNKRPSFHIDLHTTRKPTEVRWLHGAVAQHGAECGVATPINRTLTETLEALATGQRSVEEFRRRPEALLRLIKL